MDTKQRCLKLSDNAMKQADNIKKWFPKKHKDNSQYFELAGNHYYGMLKRRYERVQND